MVIQLAWLTEVHCANFCDSGGACHTYVLFKVDVRILDLELFLSWKVS